MILWDKDKSIAKAYNPEKMPTAFIIDKEGKITSIHAGYTAGEQIAQASLPDRQLRNGRWRGRSQGRGVTAG